MFNASWLLVGAVYATAVWLARRAAVDLPRRIAVLFYLLVLLFLRDPLTRDVVNLPVDYLRTLPPWSHLTRDHQSHNGEMNDLVLQIAPWAHQTRESWRSLEPPLWNHLSAAGYPLLANAQSAALSPLRIVALPLPLGQSFAAEAAMKLLIALTFTFLFCRGRGFGDIASVSAAIAFGFSSFLLIWLHFPMGTAAAYVPAVFYMVDRIAERRTLGRVAFGAALWASILFAGHPETAAHTFFIALLYTLWVAGTRLGRNELLRFFTALGVTMAVAALLAAPFLAPFAENMTKSKRYSEVKSKPPPGWYFSDWPSFVVLLQPKFFGDVPREEAWGPARAESMTGFAGALGIGAWFAVLAHVVVRRRWRSAELFFVLMALVVVGALFDVSPFSDLFTNVFHLAANTRLRLFFCFMLAILTGTAIDLAVRGERLPFLIGLLASSGVLAYLFFTTSFPHSWDRDSAVLAMLPSILVLALAAAVPFAGRRQRVALMLVTVALVAELWAIGRAWLPNVRETLMYPTTPLLTTLSEIRAQLPENEPFRVVGTGPTLFPNLSAVFGFEDVRAHDPMAGSRYVGLLRVLTGYDTEDYFPKWEDLDTGLLDFLNVRFVLTTRGATLADAERFRMVYDGRDGRIFENTSVLPRAFAVRNVILEFRDDLFMARLQEHDDWRSTALLESLPVENDQMRNDLLAPRPPTAPEARLSIVEARPARLRLRVDAPRYTLVATSIPWWPGWKARTTQRALRPVRVNATFFGAVVPPGRHEVEIYYAPATFWAGSAVAGLTILGLLGAALWRRSRTSRAAVSGISC